MLRQQQDPNVAMGRYTFGRLHLLLRGRTVEPIATLLQFAMTHRKDSDSHLESRTPWKAIEDHEFILQFLVDLPGIQLNVVFFLSDVTGSPRYEMDAVAPHASVAPLVHKHFEIQA